MQKTRDSIANAPEYVFLALSHPYKECHLWVTPTNYFLQCNEITLWHHSWSLRNDGEAVPLEFKAIDNPMPANGHIRPGMEWLLWYQTCVQWPTTRMWFFQVIMHNHAKGMKSVISLFQRYEQHKYWHWCRCIQRKVLVRLFMTAKWLDA